MPKCIHHEKKTSNRSFSNWQIKRFHWSNFLWKINNNYDFKNLFVKISVNLFNAMYRIMSVLKVETDIITSMAMILLVMQVETFKTDIIVLIGNVIVCLASH